MTANRTVTAGLPAISPEDVAAAIQAARIERARTFRRIALSALRSLHLAAPADSKSPALHLPRTA